MHSISHHSSDRLRLHANASSPASADVLLMTNRPKLQAAHRTTTSAKNTGPWPAILAVTASLWGASAQAYQPLVSEPATHLERGSCVVDFKRDGLKASTGGTRSRYDAEFACGAGARSQYTLGISSEEAAQPSTLSRQERYSLAGKTTVWTGAEGETQWGLRYALDWAALPGQSTQLDLASLQVLASKALSSSTSVHANLGFARQRLAGKTEALWAVGIETGGRWQLAADVYGQGSKDHWASAGVGYAAFSDVMLSLRLAQSLNDSNTQRWSLGLRLVY